MHRKIRRIAVLFSRLSGYMTSCLKQLSQDHQIELLVIRQPPSSDAPFDEQHFEWIANLYNRDSVDVAKMHGLISSFEPDALFMVGWADKEYLKVARAFRKNGGMVIAGSDAQPDGSLKQKILSMVSPWYLQNAIDILWVAGERQRQLASKLGFGGIRCLEGYYACDWQRFANIHLNQGAERPRAFLYVGRYIHVKGLDLLVKAYAKYREKVAEPWPLLCAGTGVWASKLLDQEGIQDLGFVQPDALPELLGNVSGFILPSRREPWGVVVQEAAAAGLPLICSDACGAAVHLLLDRYNGYLFENEHVDHLAWSMMQLSSHTAEEWSTMSMRSHELSKQYTPERWADMLLNALKTYQAI